VVIDLLENVVAMRGIYIALRAHRRAQHERIRNFSVLINEDEMIRTAALAADGQDFLFGRSVGELDTRDIL
jgi:hypothetical protein